MPEKLVFACGGIKLSIYVFQQVFKPTFNDDAATENNKLYSPSETRNAFLTAEQNKLLLPFYRNATTLGINLEEFVIRFKDEESKSLKYNSMLLVEISRISQIFQREKIDFVFYKGPITQMRLYSTYFFRRCADIDVYVSPENYQRAAQALTRAGYKLPAALNKIWWWGVLGEQHFLFPNGPGSVDLHRRLQQPGAPSPRHPDRFITQAQMVELGQLSIPTPSLIHCALISALNLVKGVQHKEPSARHGIDLLRSLKLLDSVQVEQLWAEADYQGLAQTLTFSLELAGRVFGCDVSAFSGRPLKSVRKENLEDLMLCPNSDSVISIKRRSVLREVCPNNLSFVKESAHWIIGEAVRMLNI